ncbi:hypothetical protein HYFRA_00000177 [Hymenoscyphus fraxineus]|uniref:C2H2-type domain-containing protein n=1 Tax=Hymenoscyphus fraxineus TaxID=746836 RepID=A0A9N9L6D8_9HELO|nr:hypothetical protein HYFRA_00000177 [Hymenoscyphus fraxineus]
MSEPFDNQAFNLDDWMTFPEDQSFMDLDPSFDSMLPVEGGMDLGGSVTKNSDLVNVDHMNHIQNPVESLTQPPVLVEKERFIQACVSCNEVFEDVSEWASERLLSSHAKKAGHAGYACSVRSCDQVFIHYRERDAHQERPHTLGHGRRSTAAPYDCIQCGESSFSKADLLRHAKKQQHQPYACECGASFSRLDVLNRHLEKFSDEEPKYPCKYCKLHRGPEGFRRHDHLLQHMRNYHNHDIESKNLLKYSFPVCSYPECPEYRDESFTKMSRKEQDQNKPFSSRSAYTKHMREAHNETPYPCDVPGCLRVGRKGYFREKDLIKHRKDEHPESDAYHVIPRLTRTNCLDCGVSLDPSSLQLHVHNSCPNRWNEWTDHCG